MGSEPWGQTVNCRQQKVILVFVVLPTRRQRSRLGIRRWRGMNKRPHFGSRRWPRGAGSRSALGNGDRACRACCASWVAAQCAWRRSSESSCLRGRSAGLQLLIDAPPGVRSLPGAQWESPVHQGFKYIMTLLPFQMDGDEKMATKTAASTKPFVVDCQVAGRLCLDYKPKKKRDSQS